MVGRDVRSKLNPLQIGIDGAVLQGVLRSWRDQWGFIASDAFGGQLEAKRNKALFFRSVGSVPKAGPVRSGLRSGIGLALISIQITLAKMFSTARKVFQRCENFW